MKGKSTISHDSKFEYYAYLFLLYSTILIGVAMLAALVLTAGKSIMISMVCCVGLVFITMIIGLLRNNLRDIRISDAHSASLKQ